MKNAAIDVMEHQSVKVLNSEFTVVEIFPQETRQECALCKITTILLDVMALIGTLIFILRNTMGKKRKHVKNIINL